MLVQNFADLRDVHAFVKWAGGKGQLLPQLDKLIPSQFNRYFEPFLRGAAMFIHLASKNMISTAYTPNGSFRALNISSINLRAIALYCVSAMSCNDHKLPLKFAIHYCV